MTAVRLMKGSMLGTVAASLVLLASAGSAFAEAPWWNLSSALRPANLVPGTARDEVEEVTVSATAGSFELWEVEESGAEREARAAQLPFNATAAEVQAGVEQSVYGGGREVEVAEGSGDTPEHHAWVVTFPDQFVRPMGTTSSGLSGDRGQPRRRGSHGDHAGEHPRQAATWPAGRRRRSFRAQRRRRTIQPAGVRLLVQVGHLHAGCDRRSL
jgi:hypothetical protein